MRTERLKEVGEAYYHVISRVVDRRFVFDDDEKERYSLILRQVEAFSGVKILTHCVMGNHTLCGAPHKTWFGISTYAYRSTW